jgi:hypothetical protein
MAQFTCNTCGHTQLAQDGFVGRQVKCPKCQAVGSITADVAAAGAPVTPLQRRSWRRATWGDIARLISRINVRRLIPTFPMIATFLLACSVVLQVLILLRLPNRGSRPIPVSIRDITTTDDVPVSIRDITTVDQLPVSIRDVTTLDELPVSINTVRALRIPVSVEDISTTDELRVNLYNHYIIGADPIPVRMEQ